MALEIQNNGAKEIKVLLVDDDLAALEELKDIVDLEGWKAKTETSVDGGLRALENDPDINVVVSDCHFDPSEGDGANGIQFISRAQARFPDRELSYIVLSGDPDVLKSSLQVGAFKFLSKPLLLDDFVEAIKTAKESGGGETENAGLSQKMIAI